MFCKCGKELKYPIQMWFGVCPDCFEEEENDDEYSFDDHDSLPPKDPFKFAQNA